VVKEVAMSTAIHPRFLKSEHYFDRLWRQEQAQLARLEAAQYPETLRSLALPSIREGWHCLVVGAGSGVTAEWLCQRVGQCGTVLATDKDPRFLYGLDYPNLQVCRHDVLRDALPSAEFDFVHARLLVQPVSERDRALARITTAIKPGGWLLAEGLHAWSSIATFLKEADTAQGLDTSSLSRGGYRRACIDVGGEEIGVVMLGVVGVNWHGGNVDLLARAAFDDTAVAGTSCDRPGAGAAMERTLVAA
jgi:hypothetical protein